VSSSISEARKGDAVEKWARKEKFNSGVCPLGEGRKKNSWQKESERVEGTSPGTANSWVYGTGKCSGSERVAKEKNNGAKRGAMMRFRGEALGACSGESRRRGEREGKICRGGGRDETREK